MLTLMYDYYLFIIFFSRKNAICTYDCTKVLSFFLFSRLALTVEERENLGRLCKLLIDHGRLDYLNSMGYTASLEYYTEPEVSLENVLLIAVP